MLSTVLSTDFVDRIYGFLVPKKLQEINIKNYKINREKSLEN
jgi:hypothetical protein